MQTRFDEASLRDPAIARAEAELRRCVHCGFCNARCPTYRLTGDELDSPRGRIYLMKEMLESGAAPSARVVHHLDRCLSCLSCKTTCPSGVDYMRLIDHGRQVVAQRHRRPFPDRLVRGLIKRVFPEPGRFGPVIRLAGVLGALLACIPPRVRRWMGRLPAGTQVNRWLSQAEMARLRHHNPLATPPPAPVPGGNAPAVLILDGCVQPALGQAINTATHDLVHRLGYRAVSAVESACCGAIEAHLGDTDRAHDRIRRNIDNWQKQMAQSGAEHIVVTASGCGTLLKHYGDMCADDPLYAGRAAELSAATRDLSEWLEGVLPPSHPTPANAPNLVYHGACSLQHGQRIHGSVVTLLRRLGFTVQEPDEAFICCGSAGTYNLLQPRLADELGMRKARHLAATGADLVVAGNLGCALQIERHGPLRVAHLAELVNWALASPATSGSYPVQQGGD